MGRRNKIIAVGGNRILLVRGTVSYRLPEEDEVSVSTGAETFEFGDFMAVDMGDCVPAAGKAEFETVGLRDSWRVIPADEYEGAIKGAELLNWNAEERYCCRDGALLTRHSAISKKCRECGTEYFPRLNPAIVVLVKKGDKALLVHSGNLRRDVMALVAGFVETGESLEECVRREVREETSLEIDNIHYHGSQSWPFPHQLMVGFTATWKSGEVRFADGELTAGDFFSRENPPTLPSMPSLTRMMIDAWIRGEL